MRGGLALISGEIARDNRLQTMGYDKGIFG